MRIKVILLFIILLVISIELVAQVQRIPIGSASMPTNAEIRLTLIHRLQHYNNNSTHENDIFDTTIHSPKSVNILDSSDKFYIHSLEGCLTSVYSLSTHRLIKPISH